MSDHSEHTAGSRFLQLGQKSQSRSDSDRRSTGRLLQESLACNLGPVLDLSAGGIRVICRKVPKDPVLIDLIAPNDKLRLHARVAWVKPHSLFRKEVGLRFINLTPETARILTRLSLVNRVAREIHFDDAA